MVNYVDGLFSMIKYMNNSLWGNSTLIKGYIIQMVPNLQIFKIKNSLFHKGNNYLSTYLIPHYKRNVYHNEN